MVDNMTEDERNFLFNQEIVSREWKPYENPEDLKKHVALCSMLGQANKWGYERAKRELAGDQDM